MQPIGVIICVVGIICWFASGFAYWPHLIWLAGIGIYNCAPKSSEPTPAARPSPVTLPAVPLPPPPQPFGDAPPTILAARFFIYIADAVKGPYSVEQIQALQETGAASADSQVCREGTQDWKPLSNFSI